MENNLSQPNQQLFADIRQMIEDTRQAVSQAVNAGLTMLYWNIGKRIDEEVLKNERAEYGMQIVASLSRHLVEEYGGNYYYSFSISSLVRPVNRTIFSIDSPSDFI